MDKAEEIYQQDLDEKVLSEAEAKGLAKMQREFLESYASSKDKIPVEEWLSQELHKQLPEYPVQKIQEMSTEIISSLKAMEDMKVSQQQAIDAGRSMDSWFASAVLKSTSGMSAQESMKYVQGLDDAVKSANEAMYRTITTKGSGYVAPSMNPNLDGYIAEQHHVNTFNMEAAAKGSGMRAEVQSLRPGETYTKNGFDVVIKDAAGKRVHQYQMKYGATAEDTIRMINSGNYNNQTLVVPEEQLAAVQEAFPHKTVRANIGEGDILSKPLTKAQAKKLQEKAQAGNFVEADWNDYVAKDIAMGIGRQTGYACLQGAAIGAGMSLVQKAWNGEPVDGEEVIKTAVLSGADFGVKTATAGALKAATEKGILTAIPKGTSANVFSGIAFTAVENLKVAGKVATGELTVKEGLYAMAQTTSSCVAGMAAAGTGTEIGIAIGSALGPVGAAVGGFIGGTIGYMAGSKIGQTVVNGAKTVCKAAAKVVGTIGSAVCSVGSAVASGIGSIASGIAGFIGGLFS